MNKNGDKDMQNVPLGGISLDIQSKMMFYVSVLDDIATQYSYPLNV